MLNRWLYCGLLVCMVTSLPGSSLAQEGENLEELAEEHAGDEPVPSGATEAAPRLPVASQAVEYGQAADQPLSGFAAHPESHEAPLPGLVVIHEWWGLNDNIRAMTERLAGEGYMALAVDLYGGQVADTPEGAMALMQVANENGESTTANLRAAIDWVKAHNGGAPVGVIGWCFGGGQALQATLANPELVAGTVIYYGMLVSDAEALSVIQAPVLGIFGSEDSHITVESVRSFETAMNEAGKSVEIHVYEADHAFANPSGHLYQAEAAAQAWEETVEFLRVNLGGGE